MSLVPNETRVAYFSMEIALEPRIPTYAGGLGVLAGDTLRSGADLGVPMVAVSLLHRQGYFDQRLDATGRQREEPVYLLDSELPENAEADRALTGSLYGGDARYRLSQEIVLGIGGLRLLRALGYRRIHRFHLNEGHASLVALALLDELRDAESRPRAPGALLPPWAPRGSLT